MQLFSYHKKIIAFIISFTFLLLFIHFIICSNINNFKISASIITHNYVLFKAIYPIIYLLLSIMVYYYSVKFNTSSSLPVVYFIYFIIMLLVMLSSIFTLKYANFIFSFWCLILALCSDAILCYLLYSSSFRFIYIGGIHLAILSYISVVNFWLYYNVIK